MATCALSRASASACFAGDTPGGVRWCSGCGVCMSTDDGSGDACTTNCLGKRGESGANLRDAAAGVDSAAEPFAAAPDCWTREYVSVKWEGVLEMDALRYAGLLNESAIMPAASDKRWLPAATATTLRRTSEHMRSDPLAPAPSSFNRHTEPFIPRNTEDRDSTDLPAHASPSQATIASPTNTCPLLAAGPSGTSAVTTGPSTPMAFLTSSNCRPIPARLPELRMGACAVACPSAVLMLMRARSDGLVRKTEEASLPSAVICMATC
mmetsp:Transcript_61100/g.89618  ORF Transcript_61100/g.89618 Transcript_61100/m.89618 type:complete len:266 (-) Transcript_61100:643-1440(-)